MLGFHTWIIILTSKVHFMPNCWIICLDRRTLSKYRTIRFFSKGNLSQYHDKQNMSENLLQRYPETTNSQVLDLENFVPISQHTLCV